MIKCLALAALLVSSNAFADTLVGPEKATAKPPAVFKVKFKTTKGDFVVTAHRDWAPGGAQRFYNLVKIGFFDNSAFFRVIDGFMVQFGLAATAAMNDKWKDANLEDDPQKEHNTRGYLSFAMAGPNTRTTQMFINFADNTRLDAMGFAPFGQVTSGMEVVDQLYKGYGEGAPMGQGPNQEKIQAQGNDYLKTDFPKLDYIKSAKIQSK